MGSGIRRTVWALSLAGALTLGLGATPAFASSVILSANPTGSQLQINGDNNDDAITVSQSGGTITITDTGTGGVTTADPDCTQVNPTTVTCPLQPVAPNAPVTSLFSPLGNGVDSFTNQNLAVHSEQITADSTNTGAKTITGGPASGFYRGGRDGDTIDGGGGDDFVTGGGFGPFTADGADTLIGGPGADAVNYFDRLTGVSLTLNGQADDGSPGEGDNLLDFEIVGGGQGDDVIVGDAGSNELRGNDGSDLIDGREGNDDLFGDDVEEDPGDDGLIGGPGRDSFNCSFGFDTVAIDPDDQVGTDCERRGAQVSGDTSLVSKKGKAKVRTRCPSEEFAPCAGTLKLLLNGRRIARGGKFSIAAGKSKGVAVSLTKPGRKSLSRADGTLLVSAEAQTNEPIGLSVDRGKVLLEK